MRPTPGPLHDNPRPASRVALPPTRRQFAFGVVFAALGSRLSAQAAARRIVSTAPSITESLFALGLGDRVVGVSRFCKFPASVLSLPKVGSYLAPDAEAIARLAPDLVILEQTISDLTGRLNALRIPYLEVPHSTLDDVYTCISLIAKAALVPERAAALNERMKRDLAALQAKAKALPSPRVLIIVDRRPGMLADLTAVGPGNYLETLTEIAGGTNVLAKPGLPMYPRISLETVLRDDPDVIIDLSAHADSEAERLAASAQVVALWSQQSQLVAVRNGRVIVGSSNALVVPGPRAPEAARLLFDYMHAAKGRAS